MKLLIDAQLPPRLVERLSAAGHAAVHVFTVLPPEASDVAVAEAATKLRAALLTKDEDFLDLSMRGVLQSQLVWLRTGNMTTDGLWRVLQPQLAAIETALLAGERVIEVW